jgi:L-alanine-DL-glutamate epimerase-like enolase superfamily enzyme
MMGNSLDEPLQPVGIGPSNFLRRKGTASMKITKLETFLVKPRWLFLKIHTDEGLVGLGEPILEGRALTCAQAVAELAPYLEGQDPTRSGASLAGHVQARLLPRRTHPHQRPQRH